MKKKTINAVITKKFAEEKDMLQDAEEFVTNRHEWQKIAYPAAHDGFYGGIQ